MNSLLINIETDFPDVERMRIKWNKWFDKQLEKKEEDKYLREQAMKKRKLKVKIRNNHIEDFDEEFEEVFLNIIFAYLLRLMKRFYIIKRNYKNLKVEDSFIY